MNEITQIQPITDEHALELASSEAFADLVELITSMPVRGDSPTVKDRFRQQGVRAGLRPTRRWTAGVGLAAVVIAAVLAVTTLGHAGSKLGPVNLGPANAQALTFKTQGRYLVVIIRNPLADPARYKAEFARHHLNIKLQMIAASPSIVGQVVFIGGLHLNQLKPITSDAAKCRAQGGSACQIGVKVSTNYQGAADIGFARAARPGERYESSGSVTSPGEAMHGVVYQGKTVQSVLAMLRERHVTVPQYRWTDHHYSKSLTPSQVPGDWKVTSAIPWAAHQVMLFVEPRLPQ
jgi:hypothetical protein